MAGQVGIRTVLLGDSSPIRAPALAYGTGTAWFNSKEKAGDSDSLVASVVSALKLGFRHVDCAEMYKNEQHVGRAIKMSSIPRQDIFVTSKIYPSLDAPEAGLRASLTRLGLTYLDLYLVHSPFKFKSQSDMETAWRGLERCVSLGLTRSLGVSNFRIQDLQQLLQVAKVKPVVNQMEYHPYLQSPELVAFCRANNIKIEGYGSLGPILGGSGGPLDPVLEKISAVHGSSKAQVLLSWSLQKGCMVVTTTSKTDRMKEYLAASSLVLSDDEVKEIDRVGMQREYRRFWLGNFAQARI